MKLLLVSNFADITDEHHVLNLLFCEGLAYFHLRKHDYTTRQMARYIERIAEPFRNRVVLHSHFDLIEEYGLRGAHFTKKYTYEEFLQSRELPTGSDQPKVFGHLSFSLHSITEIQRMPLMYDYLFLSPVFDSISNQGYNSKFRAEELHRFLHHTQSRPAVIALGGINDNVVDDVATVGFDGMALLGYIWTTFEQTQNISLAVKRFRLIQSLVRNRMEILSAETGVRTSAPAILASGNHDHHHQRPVVPNLIQP